MDNNVETKYYCKTCGTEVMKGQSYCIKCFKKQKIEKAKQTAPVATVVFIIIYIIILFAVLWVADLGKKLSGGTSPTTSKPFLLDIAGFLALSFMGALPPFLISILNARTAKMNKLFWTDMIILAVHIIFFCIG